MRSQLNICLIRESSSKEINLTEIEISEIQLIFNYWFNFRESVDGIVC